MKDERFHTKNMWGDDMYSEKEKQMYSIIYPGMARIAAYEDSKDSAVYTQITEMVTQLEPLAEQYDYDKIPFYMIYQTNYCRKERYAEIVQWLLYYEEAYQPNDGGYLMMLAATAGMTSEIIFEHYMAIRKLLKNNIGRVLLQPVIAVTGSAKERIELYQKAYAIWKACSLGILQTEKYSRAADELLKVAGSDRFCMESDEESKLIVTLLQDIIEEIKAALDMQGGYLCSSK